MLKRLRPIDAKQAAIEQWTADPCGPDATAAVGTVAYFDQLVARRHDYAPWMDRALDYSGCGGLSVLDIGCGQGIDLARYGQSGALVTGIDFTPRHVDLARQHLCARDIPGQVVQGDAEALPFPDDSFDRVSSNGVLHHTPDMASALREARRVLRPGGLATIIVYNRSSLHYWVHQFLYRGLLRGWLIRERSMAGVLSGGVERTSIAARPLVRVYSPRQMRRLMARARFSAVHTEVRHLRSTDTLPTRLLERRPDVLDALGGYVGWYIIARGFA